MVLLQTPATGTVIATEEEDTGTGTVTVTGRKVITRTPLLATLMDIIIWQM